MLISEFRHEEITMKQHHWTTALIILGVMTVWAGGSNAQKVTGVEKKSLTNHKHGISSIDFTSNSNLMASGNWDKTVILWSMRSCAVQRTRIACSAFGTRSELAVPVEKKTGACRTPVSWLD